MVIMESGDQPDVSKLWGLLTEFMEQTNQHRQFSAQLHAQANGVKSQAIHSQTGFVLRRFNLDKSKEEYDAELERMNASVAADNVALQHDNKQLNALIREYESTLEMLMDQFRNRAHEVQEHELTLIRTFEEQLLQREDNALYSALAMTSTMSGSLTRASQLLRQAMRALQGEDLDEQPESAAYTAYLENTLPQGTEPGDWDAVARADWALERECELARLEDENQMLRRLLGIKAPGNVAEMEGHERVFHGFALDPSNAGPIRDGEWGMANEGGRMSAVPMPSIPASRPPGPHMLGGPKGTVGPFGSYKRLRVGMDM